MPSLPPKATFIMGLLGGVAVVSTIGFFILLPKVLGNRGENNNGSNGLGNTAPSAPSVAAPTPRVAVDAGKVPPITKEDYVRGDANAPVTMVEYSDFECPFCLRHLPNIERVLSEYKGKVKLVYRHFPLSFHPQAQKAAEAYECAGEQGGAEKAYLMHDKIFESNQNQTMGVDQWKKIAKDIKLNSKKFDDCLDTGKFANKIRQQMAGGSAAGVSGTPATFINGQLVSGAVPYEQLKSVIDGQL